MNHPFPRHFQQHPLQTHFQGVVHGIRGSSDNLAGKPFCFYATLMSPNPLLKPRQGVKQPPSPGKCFQASQASCSWPCLGGGGCPGPAEHLMVKKPMPIWGFCPAAGPSDAQGEGGCLPHPRCVHIHVCSRIPSPLHPTGSPWCLGEGRALWRHEPPGVWLCFIKTLEIPHSHALVSRLPFGNHPWPVPCSEPCQQRSAQRGLLGAAAWFRAARASLIQPLLAQRSCFPPQK